MTSRMTGRDGGRVALRVVGGVDHPFDELRAGPEVGERQGAQPARRIIGEADGAGERIGPALRTAQGWPSLNQCCAGNKETKEATQNGISRSTWAPDPVWGHASRTIRVTDSTSLWLLLPDHSFDVPTSRTISAP